MENKNWEEEFERTEYNKLAFLSGGAKEWKKNHNEKIHQLLSQEKQKTKDEIIERIKGMFNTNEMLENMSFTYVKGFEKALHNVIMLIKSNK